MDIYSILGVTTLMKAEQVRAQDKLVTDFVRLCLCLGVLVSLLFTGHNVVLAAEPVIRAVLFYSPTCSHCHYVITEVITPLMEQYGEQCQIVGINVADAGGQALYQAAIQAFAIPDDRLGVPTLIIGETVLVGSGEIPEQLPGMVADYLAKDGVDWPAIPGFEEALAANEPTSEPKTTTTDAPDMPTATPVPAVPGISTERPDWRTLFARDPVGNGISVLVLLGMLVSVLLNIVTLRHGPSAKAQQRWIWVIPPLVVLGLIVAGYLAYVETQQVIAVCGPVGDCNAVQQSEFALLFGFLPIAVLGLIGYIAIGIAWAVARFGRGPWVPLAKVAMVGMAWFGMLFSIYLTFLEPFVIGATCAWCLTSAVVMTLLLWVIVPLTRPALRGAKDALPAVFRRGKSF